MLKSNLGSIDRMSRVIIGAILMGYWVMIQETPWNWLMWVLLVAGIYLLASGLLARCVVLGAFGISTAKSE